MVSYTYIDSPMGPLLLVGDAAGLRRINFQHGAGARQPEADWQEEAQPFQEAVTQLEAYFAGSLQTFTLRLAAAGTPFQLAVWRRLQEIPYGATTSYGALARQLGKPRASRAVGAANGQNPLPIVIPCHRVIGSSGKLTGYAGGLAIKAALLDLERRHALFCPCTGRRQPES